MYYRYLRVININMGKLKINLFFHQEVIVNMFNVHDEEQRLQEETTKHDSTNSPWCSKHIIQNKTRFYMEQQMLG